MHVRLSISAKIFLWLFLNLLAIAAVAWFFLPAGFRPQPQRPLNKEESDHVSDLGNVVSTQLRLASRDQWGEVLDNLGKLYKVHLALFRADGGREAGASLEPPGEIKARFLRPHPPGPPPDRNGGPPPPGAGPPPLPPRPSLLHSARPNLFWLSIPVETERLPVPDGKSRPAQPPPQSMVLVIASESPDFGGLLNGQPPLLWVLSGLVAGSVVFWLPLLRGMTRSIREVTAATARIAEGRFDVRLHSARNDELGLLAESVNRMAGRLDGFVQGQKRFLGDIAHELCSPLARAQIALGILERRIGAEDAGSLADLEEEIQEMSSLVNELLSFSKASLAAGQLKPRAVALRAAVERAVEREKTPGAEVRSDVAEDIAVFAEPGLIERALANLLRNAIKYAGDAGPVEIAARREGGEVLVTVSDCGSGVPEEAIAQLFDPFYRVDISRTRETGGAGLGLAIVKTCVESCGGRVSCGNRAPHGLCVSITLPAA